MGEDKGQIEEIEEKDKRSNLNIKQFMNDMNVLRIQLQDKDLVKPVFDYGASEVTNYLLWLCLGELMILNDEVKGE